MFIVTKLGIQTQKGPQYLIILLLIAYWLLQSLFKFTEKKKIEVAFLWLQRTPQGVIW